MAIDSDLLRGHVDTIILKTLASGDKYGYEIIKEIETKSDGTFELKQPTLYSCLKRLENQGFISAYWVNSDIGGKRHYYKLTDQGRKEYNSNMSEWRNSRNIIDNLIFNENENYEHDEFQELNKDNAVHSVINNSNAQTQSQESFIDSPPAQEVQQPENEEIIEAAPTREQSENPQIITDYYKTDENQFDIFSTQQNVTAQKEDNIINTQTIKNSPKEENIIIEKTTTDNYYSSNPQVNQSIKFNIKDFKTSRNNYFANSKDSVYDDEIVEQKNVTPPAEEHISTPFVSQEPPVQKTEEQPSQDYHKFRNYSFYESMNEEDTEEELPPLYTNEQEEVQAPLNFGYTQDEYNDDNQSSDWTKDFVMQNEDEDEFKYDYDRDEEESESREIAIKEEYDTPAIEEQNEVAIVNNDNQANLFTDNKRKFTRQYTDNESKQVLNTLSSYGSTNFSEREEEKKDARIIRTTYDEYKEELNSTGIDIKPYKKKVKENAANKEYILTNQIKFITSMISYISVAISLVIGYFIATAIGYTDFTYVDTNMSPSLYLIFALIAMLAIPCTFAVIFFLNQTKKAKPKYSAKIAIIFSLLFFIQCLVIIYAINIPFGLYSFVQKDYNHLLWLLPSVCSLYIPIHAIVYTILFRTKKFHV